MASPTPTSSRRTRIRPSHRIALGVGAIAVVVLVLVLVLAGHPAGRVRPAAGHRPHHRRQRRPSHPRAGRLLRGQGPGQGRLLVPRARCLGARRRWASASPPSATTASAWPVSAAPTPAVSVPGTEAGNQPLRHGQDPALDALWSRCAAGSGAACDDLFDRAPVGSAVRAVRADLRRPHPADALRRRLPPPHVQTRQPNDLYDVAVADRFAAVVTSRLSRGRASGASAGGGAWGRGRRAARCGARRRARGPAATGVSPAWARRRAVHQSVRRLVGQRRPPSASMRAAEAAGVLALVGPHRSAEGDRGRRRLRDVACPCAGCGRCPRCARARPARRSAATGRRRRRGTADPSRRGCGRPRGRSACSSRRRCSAAASSADLRPTLVRSIGMAPMHERRQRRGDAVAEEVVGGGGDERCGGATARGWPRASAGCRRGCGGWRRRSTGPSRSARRSRPRMVGDGQRRHRRAHRALEQQHPGHAGRVAAGPLGVVVGAERARLARRLDASGVVGAQHGKQAPAHEATVSRRRPGPSTRLTGMRLASSVDRRRRRGRPSRPGAIGSRHVRHEDRRVVEVRDRGVAADDVAGHLERVLRASTPA